MRDILFRGKIRHDYAGAGEWAFGDYVDINGTPVIWERGGLLTPIAPETLGQYTGIEDKNGNPIYEGDIVLCEAPKECFTGTVAWSQGGTAFIIDGDDTETALDWYNPKQISVIGAIHD